MAFRKSTKRSFKKRRPASKKKQVQRAVRSVNNRIFRKRVKSVVMSVSETKHISVRNTKFPMSLNVSNNVLTSNMFILTPCQPGEVIPYGGISGPGIGSSDGQREGNKIRVVKSFLNLVITPENYDVDTNSVLRPMNGRLWFFRSKRAQQTVPSGAAICGATGNFLQDGTGMSGLAGNLSDNLMFINKDLYTYLGHKDFKLGFAAYNATNTNNEPTYQYFHNNDYRMNYIAKINTTRYTQKEFAWDDAGLPVTPYTYCLLQLVNADGSTQYVNQLPARVVYEQGFYYKDL